ncbi:MAG: hypothetical protein ACRDIY_10035 [Chloroflexota bacterium]
MSPRLARVGALGGAAAGIVYLMVEQILAVLHDRPVDEPLRLFTSTVLGARALAPVYPVNDAILVGSVVVLAASTILGLVFAALTFHFPGLAATVGTLIIAGGTYGGGLWLLNFYVLGSFFWPWLTQTDPTVQLACAAVGYGASLGAGFALAGVHRSSQLE